MNLSCLLNKLGSQVLANYGFKWVNVGKRWVLTGISHGLDQVKDVVNVASIVKFEVLDKNYGLSLRLYWGWKDSVDLFNEGKWIPKLWWIRLLYLNLLLLCCYLYTFNYLRSCCWDIDLMGIIFLKLEAQRSYLLDYSPWELSKLLLQISILIKASLAGSTIELN